MKYIRFDYAGFYGTDTYEFGKFDDSATDEEIVEIAEELCYNDYDEENEDVKPELYFSWKEVPESEVEMNKCVDYTK